MYDASTGRSGGGNFQLVTRSGTNAFRGTGHYSGQHERFNENDFFYEKDGIDKPKARRNEGGFTLGGPLRQNRLFFFGGYQRTDAETGFVPTANSITALPQALPGGAPEQALFLRRAAGAGRRPAGPGRVRRLEGRGVLAGLLVQRYLAAASAPVVDDAPVRHGEQPGAELRRAVGLPAAARLHHAQPGVLEHLVDVSVARRAQQAPHEAVQGLVVPLVQPVEGPGVTGGERHLIQERVQLLATTMDVAHDDRTPTTPADHSEHPTRRSA